MGCSSVYYFPLKDELIDRSRLSLQPEDVFFQSEDGTRLHGWYFKLSIPQKPKAVILHFHGNGENLSTHFYALYRAPAKGYEYLTFDYRGYGKSEGEPTPRGVVEDGKAALRWIKKRHPDLPIIVMGQSLGGAIALRTVLDMKNEIPVDFVVADSTFISYRSAARSVFAKNWFLWLFQPIAWLIADNSQSPQDDIKSLAPIPLLVIHGDKDKVVDFSLGEDLFAEASDPKEFWRIPEGQHTDFMFKNKGEFENKFFELLDSKF